ncbi:hypothetical protein FKM82_015445 [Ascaphus truei]
MKKSWMKRRSQKSGHSRRVFGRFTHAKYSAPAGNTATTLRREKRMSGDPSYSGQYERRTTHLWEPLQGIRTRCWPALCTPLPAH